MKIDFALHTYRPRGGAAVECALFYAMAMAVPAHMHFKVLAAFVTQARIEGHRIDEAALVSSFRGRPKRCPMCPRGVHAPPTAGVDAFDRD